MTQKTNAARFLDQMGIRYELREYDVDPEDLAAEGVATKIGLPPEQFFKTLVAKVIDTASAWWLFHRTRNLTAASDNRKIHLVPVKELQKLTGYIRGGVTALAAKKTYPVLSSLCR